MSTGIYYLVNGDKRVTGTSSAYGSSYTSGDVIGIAVDTSAETVTFYKNNVSQGSISGTGVISAQVFPYIGFEDSGSPEITANFGQRPFAYTPPSGFVALNTFNLSDSTIVKGNTVMDATLWTGTGSSLAITNSGAFKPDFVWGKRRNGAADNILIDSIVGGNPPERYLSSNTTNGTTANADVITSLNSNGFTVGTSGALNGSSNTYVGWQWQAGQGTTSSNTSGSITSTVSVNATAGFSIVTYTGNGTNGASIGHGLGVSPKLYIIKSRNSASGVWWVSGYPSFGAPFSANNNYLQLDQTNAIGSAATVGTTSSSSTITFNNSGVSVNANTTTYVAYCWAEIAGFSKFGSYTGNGSTNGPFVYTGFRPEFVMWKRTNAVENWYIADTSRSPFNVADAVLSPNLSNAESVSSSRNIDFLSNGFKQRTSDSSNNGSGDTYIYMAFAENPFKNANAR
jgi:hypothetical protein